MNTLIQKAKQKHRLLIESQYDGLCCIYEYQKIRNSHTKMMEYQEVLIQENIPCHLSFSSLEAAVSQEGKVVKREQSMKLFLPPEIEVKVNSKLLIVQNGIEKAYQSSGEPAVYPSHQEIVLKLFERWA